MALAATQRQSAGLKKKNLGDVNRSVDVVYRCALACGPCSSHSRNHVTKLSNSHRRTLPVPDGEPQRTLRDWGAAWCAIDRFFDAEVTAEEASYLLKLYPRLDAFGVPLSPDIRSWADAIRDTIGKADAEICESDAPHEPNWS